MTLDLGFLGANLELKSAQKKAAIAKVMAAEINMMLESKRIAEAGDFWARRLLAQRCSSGSSFASVEEHFWDGAGTSGSLKTLRIHTDLTSFEELVSRHAWTSARKTSANEGRLSNLGGGGNKNKIIFSIDGL